MDKKDYQNLLKDKRWVDLSRKIKAWDNYCCAYCGNSGRDSNLQVHHLFYDLKRMPWEYGERSLVTLCEKCHSKTHEIEKSFYEELKNKLNLLGNNGCSKSDILYLLDMFIYITSDERNANRFCEFVQDSGYGRMESLVKGVWERKHKNDLFSSINERYQECLNFARKAHKWATGKDDFTEEAYERDEYYDEIIEYRNNVEDV